jgi:GNAT superfamily N-acetyltransferase
MATLRAARAGDAPVLSEIASTAKRHWGYPAAWIALWREQLTVTPDDIASDHYVVAEVDGRIVGFIAVSVHGSDAEIEHLWVLPTAMGAGIGTALFRRAAVWCRARGMTALRVVADPNAVGFYARLGGRILGEEPSLPQPRSLPVLSVAVTP